LVVVVVVVVGVVVVVVVVICWNHNLVSYPDLISSYLALKSHLQENLQGRI
jgi:hypothetical protein